MTLQVVSPVSGEVVDLAAVPDPVFAEAIVGPGIAVEPARGSSRINVISPVSGTVHRIQPHAFIVRALDGAVVLVHLGIDTVHLKGEGFTVHVERGDEVRVGDVITSWDLGPAQRAGYSTIVPVIIMEARNRFVTPVAWTGTPILEGAPLLTLSA